MLGYSFQRIARNERFQAQTRLDIFLMPPPESLTTSLRASLYDAVFVKKESTMDVAFILLGAAFWLLMVGMAKGCAALGGATK